MDEHVRQMVRQMFGLVDDETLRTMGEGVQLVQGEIYVERQRRAELARKRRPVVATPPAPPAKKPRPRRGQ